MLSSNSNILRLAQPFISPSCTG